MSSSGSGSTTMRAAGATCMERALVDRHFAGTIASRDERAMREHVTDCEACRAHYHRHLILGTLDPLALTAEDRIGRALGLRQEPRAAFLLPIAVAIAALAVAALVLIVLRPPSSSSRDSDQFAARGSIPSGDALATTSSSSSKISVYRIANNDRPAMLASDMQLGPRDELAFAYQNGGAKTHLMIFGVDERGRVYWFHPAWSIESENPTALRIEADTHPHELREAIRHQFAGEKLEIHGLFLDGPLTVRDAEAAVRSRTNETGPVTVAGGVDHVIMFGMLR